MEVLKVVEVMEAVEVIDLVERAISADLYSL